MLRGVQSYADSLCVSLEGTTANLTQEMYCIIVMKEYFLSASKEENLVITVTMEMLSKINDKK